MTIDCPAGKVSVDEAIAQWRQARPIPSSLPIEFRDGTRLGNFAVNCSQCSRRLGGDRLRGVISSSAPDKFEITGLAACPPCASFTRFSYQCTGSLGTVYLEWSSRGQVVRQEVRTTWWAQLVAKIW